jgi:hypothetical protein
MAKKLIQKNRILKQYDYEVNGIDLKFSLYVDSTEGIISFLELIARAKNDLEADLKEIQLKRKQNAKK